MTRPRLALTPLEDRTVPAAFGNTWVDTNLTYSFAPDGTDVAGTGSNLFQTLNARATEAEWTAVVRGAFAAWTVPTNLTATAVGDDGRAIGAPGPVQGSPFVGDIRIAARPLSGNVLAITNPFDLVSPWSGEIVLNSTKVFDTDGSADSFDLYTVLLHEIGHALGVGNGSDPASVMTDYKAPRTGLGVSDVTAIQALYGKPGAPTNGGPNVIVGASGAVATAPGLGTDTNGTLRTATFLGRSRDSKDRRWDFVGAASFDSASDVDVYRVKTGERNGGGVLVAYVGTMSGAAPTVTVYDTKGKAVTAEVLTRQDGATIVQVADVKKNDTYFIAVNRGVGTWTGPEQYRVGFDFRDTALKLDTVAKGTLAPGQALVRRLEVTRSQGFRFQLSAPAGATLTVYDATGTAVFTLRASGADTAAGGALLGPGSYTVAITGTGAIGAKLLATTDPIGPALDDGYAAPSAPSAPPPPTSSSGYFWSSEPELKTASGEYGYAMW